MSKIEQQLVFKRGLTLKNRVVMAPMTTKMSFFDGVVTQDELNYYGLRTSEVGAVITAAANVQANGKGWEGELGVYDDQFIAGLSKLASKIKQNDTKAILQLFHAGRMTNSTILRGAQPVSASAIPAVRKDAQTPKALAESEILQLISDFQQATRRAIQAGFDGVELHGANTYLLQQFFSPHSNRRTDKWGGTLEKRFTFINQLVDAVNKTVDELTDGHFIVGYRFSPEEFENPGIRFGDTLYLVDHLADKPLDYLHISLNNFQTKSLSQNYQEKSMLAYIYQKINHRIPLIGVGNVQTKQDTDNILLNADLLAVGRSLLVDPHWTAKLLHHQTSEIRTKLSIYDREELVISNGVWGFLQEMMPDNLVQ